MTDLAKYGPWAVIAGGSEGVGAEFARQLAEAGFNLVLIARKPGPLSDTAEQCRDLGVEVRAISVDLLDPQSVSRIAQDTADLEVGLLIYNAGASTVLGVTRTPAMERVGLNFDAPGILVNEPAEVAAEGLAHLADGPVWVAGGSADRAEANSAADRSRVVLETHRAIAALIEGAR
ncbi:SDR family NAD(P)-dependent oxidoreductase [Mycobacterium syngnathidarum]